MADNADIQKIEQKIAVQKLKVNLGALGVFGAALSLLGVGILYYALQADPTEANKEAMGYLSYALAFLVVFLFISIPLSFGAIKKRRGLLDKLETPWETND